MCDKGINGTGLLEHLRKSIEFEMFWCIESGNLLDLQELCQKLRNQNMSIGMYWPNRIPQSVFTDRERSLMKVEFAGVMDFSCLQHACAVGFHDGVLTLYHFSQGLIQGSGLPIVNRDKFLACYNNLCQERIRMLEEIKGRK